MERLRDENGLFLPSPRKYEPLLQYQVIQDYANSYAESTRPEHLWALNEFFECAELSVEEFLGLGVKEKKRVIKSVVLQRRGQNNFNSARRVYFAIQRFMSVYDEEQAKKIQFSQRERSYLLVREVTKVSYEHLRRETKFTEWWIPQVGGANRRVQGQRLWFSVCGKVV